MKRHIPETVVTSEQTDSQEHELRIAKVKDLGQRGLAAWPELKHVTSTALQAKTEFEERKDETTEYALAGRLMTLRDHGKTFFVTIHDRSGSIQVYIKQGIVSNQCFEHFKHDIKTGDHIWVHGTLFTTKTGEITLRATDVLLMSKSLHPLPEKYHGLTNVEQRYRQRYLDLMSNEETREKFKKRSGVVSSIRHFLQEQDFIEVETPMLHPIPGGAAARPFTTHHNAYDIGLYLRIAPELYLKRLVVGGFERVFEINRNFRNEGVSTKHNPEFTMLEFYMAYGDYNDGIRLTESLISSVVMENFGTTSIQYQDHMLDFSAPFKRLSIADSLVEIGGLERDEISEKNIDACIKKHKVEIKGTPSYGVKLFALFEACVESKIIQPTFITDYPIEVSPLSKRDPQNPDVAARFELFVVGMELSNGFTELNDPFDQASRFQAQVDAREAGDDEAHYFDADYIRALEYGLPPTVGVGIGIDRLVMILTNTSSIKDVILFPTMKPLHNPAQPINPVHTANSEEKPTVFIANKKLFTDFNNTRIAVTVIKNVDNSGSCPDLQPHMTKLIEEIRNNYTTETITQEPRIMAWREAYQTFGSKPSAFPSSLESLYKRVLKGNDLKPINPLVDIYNYISLKYMLPAGGEDLDQMRGALELTYASANEARVSVLGKDTPEAPYEGEVVYKDALGTICRRWNWREVKRTILTPKTNNAVIVIEALSPISDEHLKSAQRELTELIALHCKADVISGIIDKNNTLFDFTSSKQK